MQFSLSNPVDLRNRKRDQVRQVCTLPIHATLIQCAKENNDNWGQAVLARLEACNDLVAAEAVYHSSCMINFKLNVGENSGTKGRPRNDSMTEALGVAYTLKSFGENLKDRYKEHVYFLKSAVCKGELACFKEMTDYILQELKEQGSDADSKRRNLGNEF